MGHAVYERMGFITPSEYCVLWGRHDERVSGLTQRRAARLFVDGRGAAAAVPDVTF
jgi:hypothetical protein